MIKGLFIKNIHFLSLISIGVLLMISSCKTTKDVIATDKPQAQYKKTTYQPKTSTVNIPIKISMSGLQKSINASLNGLVYEDKSYDDNDGDNLKIKVWKEGTITVKAFPDAFEYYVPLKIWAKVRYGVLGKYAYQEVQGAIALNFNTTYEINKDWNMATITKLTDYKWIKKPSIKIFGSNVSIAGIADNLLKYNKSMLEETIDTEIKNNFNIQESAKDAWSMLQEPINVDENYNIWLKLTPESIVMTPLNTENNTISSTIGIQSIAEVIMSKDAPKVIKNEILPPFERPESIPDSFALSLTTEIPYLEAVEIAKKEAVGQTFTQGKRSVTIENLNLYGQGEDLIVGVYLSGSINGNIYLRGTPVYDAATSTVSIENVEYDIETKNKLLKSANWMFQSAILKRMKKYLVFPLEDNLEEAKKMVEKEMTNYKPMEGILINGELDELGIEGLFLTPTGIKVIVASTGKIKMKIDGLTF